MRTVWFGLSITSSWGNGHATNYRALLGALRARGHEVLFLERDAPWYAEHRDFEADWIHLYESVEDLDAWTDDVRDADLVVVGSYVPYGCLVSAFVLEVARGVTAFWDLDTPVTVAKLAHEDFEYVRPELVPRFDLYLSFTGGPLLESLGAKRPTPFYCMADPEHYHPLDVPKRWELGYLGTYSDDRQPKVEELLLEPARARPDASFTLAGPQYPEGIAWPVNLTRFGNLSPGAHCEYYSSQRFTLNLTRVEMVEAGWSPSVRLFETAACGVPVISDWWEGLDAFFEPGREILIAETAEDVLRHLGEGDPSVGLRARERVLASHTADRRARELEEYVGDVLAEGKE